MSCGYCGAESSSDFCSAECKEKYEEYVLKGEKWGLLFLVLLLLPMILLGILTIIYDWGPLEFLSIFFLYTAS
jgi:predicted nucleic acid-binding Zn ribbon protein